MTTDIASDPLALLVRQAKLQQDALAMTRQQGAAEKNGYQEAGRWIQQLSPLVIGGGLLLLSATPVGAAIGLAAKIGIGLLGPQVASSVGEVLSGYGDRKAMFDYNTAMVTNMEALQKGAVPA